LLPETRDPRDAPWREDEGWILKTAYCNTGDTVCVRSLMTPGAWRRVCRQVWWKAGQWVAQRRFKATALATPLGAMYPCVGVYVVNGKAAGAYARLSRGPVVNYAAMDAALLIEEGSGER
jgi:hypothetical protein